MTFAKSLPQMANLLVLLLLVMLIFALLGMQAAPSLIKCRHVRCGVADHSAPTPASLALRLLVCTSPCVHGNITS